MTKTRRLFAGLTVVLASLLTAGSAYAQNHHSWVSSTGSGTACTRTAPCADFGTAENLTNAGGVISVLDAGDYTNGVYIQKSLTIRAQGVDGGATLIAQGAGFLIIVQAGVSDVVTLEGLHFNGAGSIVFTSGGHLHVVGCVITNA